MQQQTTLVSAQYTPNAYRNIFQKGLILKLQVLQNKAPTINQLTENVFLTIK